MIKDIPLRDINYKCESPIGNLNFRTRRSDTNVSCAAQSNIIRARSDMHSAHKTHREDREKHISLVLTAEQFYSNDGFSTITTAQFGLMVAILLHGIFPNPGAHIGRREGGWL